MNPYVNRIDTIRAAMKARGIDALIIPRTDSHLSEYIADHWQVVRWLSGFTGSAATMVVTLDAALLWTDSRYFLQAAAQLEGSGITLMKEGLPDTPDIDTWLLGHLRAGQTVGIDGMTVSIARAAELAKTLAAKGINLAVDFAPVEEAWADRPALPADKVFVHELKYAGEPAEAKMASILAKGAEAGADSVFLSALDEIAWTLNIRSNDVPCNPVATSFLYLGADGGVLFIDPVKLTPEVEAYLAASKVRTMPYTAVKDFLRSLKQDSRVLLSATQNAAELGQILGDRLVSGTSPVAMLKAVKNPVQLDGVRAAMKRDGVALVYSMMEIERRLKSPEGLTEMDVAEILTRRRGEQALYFEDSFDTIAGWAGHGAIVHYSATPESNVKITTGSLLLIDSGANYLDGTTDITRTIAVGTPSADMVHDFTLVMKGHIALATAIFPEGTRGHQLDAFAREPLWREGKLYLHGTGHGVGHFLNVHEGPQSFRLNDTMAPLIPGMITSNEPGLYLSDRYGIRCENLVLTVEDMETEFGKFYALETLTLFPFDRTLFDTRIMTPQEIAWVNDYHQRVRDELTPLLDAEGADWLALATRPL
ncbi:MAG: aminopeptidase P family protein [Candidatus Amulumruptor caecigallinarius]|nr:aminopeptidase P family protein [Candidatus Amulumruptor caecigallinarius]MCM1397071.1 aminopeptidase P family protein [Candidatus Amulumruptor caecigallinarius]MCM1454057.1 aminopeptidase P family protein [bacterium]